MRIVKTDDEGWRRNPVSFISSDQGMHSLHLKRDSSASLVGVLSSTAAKRPSLPKSYSIAQREMCSAKPNYQHDFRSPSSSSCTASMFSSDSEKLVSQKLAQAIHRPVNRDIPFDNIDEPTIDPYRMLGIKRNATDKEIRRSYIRLSLLNHPHRKHPSSDKTAEEIRRWKFIAIAASYETLIHIDHRTNYNFANTDNSRKQWGSKPKPYHFWDILKRGLEISDRDEKRLDHDGVECCSQNSFFARCICSDYEFFEGRDDDDSPGGSRPSKALTVFRGDSDNTTNTEASTYESAGRETDHVFGGILGPLYKARNHEGFTDSLELFRIVSGSDIYRFDSAFKNQVVTQRNNEFDFLAQNWLLSTPSTQKVSVLGSTSKTRSLLDDEYSESPVEPSNSLLCKSSSTVTNAKKIYPSLPILPQRVLVDLCTERPPSFGDDSTVSKKTTKETRYGVTTTITKTFRRVDCDLLVRTETIAFEPKSGIKKCNIKIQRMPAPKEDKNEERDDNFFSFLSDFLTCHSGSTDRTNHEVGSTLIDRVQ